jgi:hypothetical protein
MGSKPEVVLTVGVWGLGRLAGLDAGALLLSQPLVHAFPADVTINPGAMVFPSNWNGAQGGVVAMLVRGVLTHNGRIAANGAGFRGGPTQARRSR